MDDRDIWQGPDLRSQWNPINLARASNINSTATTPPTRNQTFLNSLPVLSLTDLVEGDNCPICVEQFQNAEDAEKPVRLPCRHIMGKDCLLKWMNSSARNNNLCPICRGVLFERRRPSSRFDSPLVLQYRPEFLEEDSSEGYDSPSEIESVEDDHSPEHSSFAFGHGIERIGNIIVEHRQLTERLPEQYHRRRDSNIAFESGRNEPGSSLLDREGSRQIDRDHRPAGLSEFRPLLSQHRPLDHVRDRRAEQEERDARTEASRSAVRTHMEQVNNLMRTFRDRGDRRGPELLDENESHRVRVLLEQGLALERRLTGDGVNWNLTDPLAMRLHLQNRALNPFVSERQLERSRPRLRPRPRASARHGARAAYGAEQSATFQTLLERDLAEAGRQIRSGTERLSQTDALWLVPGNSSGLNERRGQFDDLAVGSRQQERLNPPNTLLPLTTPTLEASANRSQTSTRLNRTPATVQEPTARPPHPLTLRYATRFGAATGRDSPFSSTTDPLLTAGMDPQPATAPDYRTNATTTTPSPLQPPPIGTPRPTSTSTSTSPSPSIRNLGAALNTVNARLTTLTARLSALERQHDASNAALDYYFDHADLTLEDFLTAWTERGGGGEEGEEGEEGKAVGLPYETI